MSIKVKIQKNRIKEKTESEGSKFNMRIRRKEQRIDKGRIFDLGSEAEIGVA